MQPENKLRILHPINSVWLFLGISQSLKNISKILFEEIAVFKKQLCLAFFLVSHKQSLKTMSKLLFEEITV